MSLPDTVFIFVLALIIFGPKKLPEIGRQIGRLVGEFRRASNEFKFQIEEELRQADRTEPQKNQNTIAAPAGDNKEDAVLPLPSSVASADISENVPDLNESVAVGQHPNLDALAGQDFSGSEPAKEKAGHELFGPGMPVSLATITAAVGSQARSTVLFAPVLEERVTVLDTEPALQELHQQNGVPGPATETPTHAGYPAPSEAETHHG